LNLLLSYTYGNHYSATIVFNSKTHFPINSNSYFISIYKPSTPEFLEIKRQEKMLGLPKPWRYESTDKGHWMSSAGSGEPANINSYSRSIGLLYKSKNTEALRKQFTESLLTHGWTSAADPFRDWDKGPESKEIYEASRDFFRKTGTEGRMCALLQTQYNANYQKDSPWLIELHIMGKTDSECPR
jgi:hypothetical protein